MTIGFFLGSLYLWQFPGAFNLALRNDVIHALMHLTMTTSGFLFWWVIIDPPPHRSRLHYGLRVLYLGLIVLPNTLLGAAITFSRGPIYSAYAEVTQPYGLSLMTDQQLGGLMLWVPGDMMSIGGRRHRHGNVVSKGRGRERGQVSGAVRTGQSAYPSHSRIPSSFPRKRESREAKGMLTSLCSKGVWIPAFAGMAGEVVR